jgi:hypothetical protein
MTVTEFPKTRCENAAVFATPLERHMTHETFIHKVNEVIASAATRRTLPRVREKCRAE